MALDTSVPATSNAILLPDVGDESVDGPFTIFTLGGDQTARIEAVRIDVVYTANLIPTDYYVVRLCTQNGAVLFEQATPKYHFE